MPYYPRSDTQKAKKGPLCVKNVHKDKRYTTTSVAGTSWASIPLNAQVCAYPAHASDVPN